MNRMSWQGAKKGMTAGLGLLLLASPAIAKDGAARKGSGKPTNLVWPLPPERPRIKFVGEIHGANEVEPLKKSGFLDRLAGIDKRKFKPDFEKPHGIATDSQDRIYVTDSSQGLVFVLDRENKHVSFIGPGSQVSLRVPLGIAVDAKDRVWVADVVGQSVYAFDAAGNALMSLGKPGEMESPTAVAVDDARHRLFIVDSKQHCILVYDSESGTFLSRIGKRGLGKGEFNFPTHVAVDRQGRVYVSDTMNFRVQIFDSEYKFVDTIGSQGNRFGQFLKPKGLALDSYQNLYVVDSDFDNFQVFDQQKRLLMFLGTVGQVPGTFWLPAGIHIDRNNYIYVADQNNRRIEIFQLLDGTTVEPVADAQALPSKLPVPTQGGATGVTTEGNSHQQATVNPKEEKSTP